MYASLSYSYITLNQINDHSIIKPPSEARGLFLIFKPFGFFDNISEGDTRTFAAEIGTCLDSNRLDL